MPKESPPPGEATPDSQKKTTDGKRPESRAPDTAATHSPDNRRAGAAASPKAPAKPDREARLAEALRANLRRRKANKPPAARKETKE